MVLSSLHRELQLVSFGSYQKAELSAVSACVSLSMLFAVYRTAYFDKMHRPIALL